MAFNQQPPQQNGAQPQADHHPGPQGTEYTLQGVMRFLQLEWHHHERARNAWDIERAEMRALISKQKGEWRMAKRINEQLDRQVKMLEGALKKEREKSRRLQQGEAVNGEETSVVEGRRKRSGGDGEAGAVKERKEDELRGDEELMAESEKEREAYVDNTTKYLKNCMKEIQYLLTPPTHPPPPQVLPNGNYTGLPEPASVEEIYARSQQAQQQRSFQRQQQQQQQAGLAGQALPQPASAQQGLNHQAAGVPNSLPQTAPQQTREMQRGGGGAQFMEYSEAALQQTADSPHPSAVSQQQQPTTPATAYASEDQIESITHTFDSRGRAIPSPSTSSTTGGTGAAVETNRGAVQHNTRLQPDPDGWTFDEAEVPQPDTPAPGTASAGSRPDIDVFPTTAGVHHPIPKSPPRALAQAGVGGQQHRRKSSGSQAMSRRRSSQGKAEGGLHDALGMGVEQDPSLFKVKFALRGHLDVVRAVIFTGGGSPSEPEVCTAGDDGMVKRWIIPASYANTPSHPPGSSASAPLPDLDITAYFTHRGHDGIVTSLATCPASTASFSTGGRSLGDGWIFSGGQDATIRVWERGRVDPKATLEGHTDAVWAVCVLPGTVGSVFGPAAAPQFGGPERLLLVSGSADGSVKVWAVSSPPLSSAMSGGSRRGVGGSRRHSVTSGSGFPSSPQPTVATPGIPFNYTLVHSIERPHGSQVQAVSGGAEAGKASPTSICPLGPNGETFVVAYTDSSVLIFDTRTGEEVIGMASNETYDGTMATSINAVVATSLGLTESSPGGMGHHNSGDAMGLGEEGSLGGGATGSREGIEGVVITGHEDRFVRFFDANSGQCTYTMLAHPSSISSLSLSKDGREAVSAGHDASIRFWSLEKRICTQDIVSHRAMRGEGVTDVAWSLDGRCVVSVGGDGVGKVFVR